MTDIELSVTAVAGAVAADELGADRIELCSAGPLGGLTPSPGLLAATLARVRRAEVHVLIRPREGGFRYRADEVAVMLADIDHACAAGAAGVVVGALTDAAAVDTAVVRDLVAAAAGRQVTFHRAFDLCADPTAAAESLADLGIRRLLSSGQAARAEDGAALLRTLTRTVGDRLDVMACGGIRAHNAVRLLRSTGVRSLHAAPTREIPAPRTAVNYGGHQEFDHAGAAELVRVIREESR